MPYSAFMDWLHHLIDIVLHLDKHLAALVSATGNGSYWILFAIIFCETGLVITPFLPGDSLLFAAGSIAAISILNPHMLVLLMIIAAMLGNTSNYFIGRWFGHKLFSNPNSKIFKQKYLLQAHDFYQRHGALAVIISRFMPIIRTFVPFVAGIATMNYKKYSLYNIIGAAAWVCLLVYTGYYFGQIPIVKQNFSLVVLAIIIISLLPLAFEICKNLLRKS